MLSCSPDDLVVAATPFQGIPEGMMPAVQTYLLAVLAGVSLDPDVLSANATAFRKLDGQQAAVQAYLLCQIANL